MRSTSGFSARWKIRQGRRPIGIAVHRQRLMLGVLLHLPMSARWPQGRRWSR
jgi:hypothetical protein